MPGCATGLHVVPQIKSVAAASRASCKRCNANNKVYCSSQDDAKSCSIERVWWCFERTPWAACVHVIRTVVRTRTARPVTVIVIHGQPARGGERLAVKDHYAVQVEAGSIMPPFQDCMDPAASIPSNIHVRSRFGVDAIRPVCIAV